MSLATRLYMAVDFCTRAIDVGVIAVELRIKIGCTCSAQYRNIFFPGGGVEY